MVSSKLAIHGGSPARSKSLPMVVPWITDDEINEVVDTLRSGYLTYGPKVAKVERSFSDHFGAPCVLVSSGTAALVIAAKRVLETRNDNAILHDHVSIKADWFVTTPFTYVATYSALLEAGSRQVVFGDISQETLNINPTSLQAVVGCGLVPVHMAGLPCDMSRLVPLSNEVGWDIIEDCAHALGAEHNGKKVGTFGRFGCFSFYPTKQIGCGDAGLIVCNRPEDEGWVREALHHGSNKKTAKKGEPYDVTFLGYKANCNDIDASLIMHQWERYPENLARRRQIAKMYRQAFSGMGPLFSMQPDDPGHAYHLFIIKCGVGVDRDLVLSALKAEGIGALIHYDRAVSELSFCNPCLGEYSNAEIMARRVLSLPIHPQMTDRDVEDVVTAMEKVYAFIKCVVQ